MNEGFLSQKKTEKPIVNITEEKSVIDSQEGFLEEEQSQEKPLWMKGPLEILDKCKKFIEKKSLNLKLGVALVVALGFIEVAQGQDMSTHNNSIEDIKSGKLKIENVVDNIFNSYKEKNNDDTYFVMEVSNSIINSDLEGSLDFSGNEIPLDDIRDTISLGNVNVKNFSVLGLENNNIYSDDKENHNRGEIFKFFLAIKIHSKDTEVNIFKKEASLTSYDETPKGALFMALYRAIRSTKVLMVTNSVLEINNTFSSSRSSSGKNNFISLSTQESNETFRDVKVIIKKFIKKIPRYYRKHSNNLDNKYKTYYSAQIIYK